MTAAMLDGRSNAIILHEKDFNSPEEKDFIVVPSTMATDLDVIVQKLNSKISLKL